MNRTAAEKAAREIGLDRSSLGWMFTEKDMQRVTDIIERACGQGATPKSIQDRACAFEQLREPRPQTNREIWEMMADFAHQELERSCGQTAWVSVEERLPADESWVLVYVPNNDPRLNTPVKAAYCTETGWEGELEYLRRVVTHWQPLPSPPTGRTEEK